jgi:hypothetical protein
VLPWFARLETRNVGFFVLMMLMNGGAVMMVFVIVIGVHVDVAPWISADKGERRQNQKDGREPMHVLSLCKESTVRQRRLC